MKQSIFRIATLGGGVLAALLLSAGVQATELPTFHITAHDGVFTPDTLEVPANTRFRVRVTNKGPGPEEFESRDLHIESVLAPGVTRTVVFAPLAPGAYPFFGEFHPATAHARIIAK